MATNNDRGNEKRAELGENKRSKPEVLEGRDEGLESLKNR